MERRRLRQGSPTGRFMDLAETSHPQTYPVLRRDDTAAWHQQIHIRIVGHGTECLAYNDCGSYCDGSVCRASSRRWPTATHTVGATLRSRPATHRGDTLYKQIFKFIDAFYWYGYGPAPRNRKGAGHFYNESAIVRPGVFFDTFPLH